MKIRIYTLRFVQFGHKGKHDRWIDRKMAANEEAISADSPPCFTVFTEP